MKTITHEEVAKLSTNAGEIQDGRFAQINSRLFEIVSYDDVDVLTVYDSPDFCGPDHKFNFDSGDIIDMWMGNENEIKAKFKELIAERL